MPDKSLRPWQVAYIESHLTSPYGPQRISGARTAYVYGFTVEEITELSGLPAWRVQQAILGDATKRTTDD